ncbi:MAG TPA: phosphatidylcholine/phosphatidylserine synthase [Pyrinomonadaceae bacterium]|jgi:CDP-diacylglycerol--serine O-phosphatidyltransferase|nr:phosphatidylcholine/phosphatidylserine synthase [Pyrinomonadaceae bacterium]
MAVDAHEDETATLLREHATENPPAPPRRGIKKGLYLLPSAFTAANISMGFYAVMGALRGFQLLHDGSTAQEFARATQHFDNAAIAIGWAVLFDMLDGRIARMTKTTTEIGVQLDSIADVLTFGIAPAVLVYAWGYGAALQDEDPIYKLGWFLSFMYVICGALRLARFNVQAMRPRPLAEGTVKMDKKSFLGLPIPAAACLIAALIHFQPAPLTPFMYGESLSRLYSVLMIVLTAVLSALMVSTIRYSSFKSAGTGRRSTRLVILIVASIGMLIWLFSRYSLLALATAYVLHGLLLRLAALFRRRSATA